jgi:hypothetical protein
VRSVKQSTATNVMVLMVDSTDHITGKASLTLTITASKNGAAFASISPTVTERGNGWYSIALTTSHTDTLGDLVIRCTGTAADPAERILDVTAGLVDADVSSRLPTASYSSPLDAAGVRTAVGLASANLDTQLTAIDDLIDTEVASIYSRIGAPAGASIAADIAAVKVDTAAVLDDTGTSGVVVAAGSKTGYALATAPLDAAGVRSAVGLAAANLDTQLTTIDDLIDTEVAAIYSRLGAPAGASISADIAAVKVDTAATLVDTTGLELTLGNMDSKLGTPSEGSISEDIAAVQGAVNQVLEDTGTTGVVVATASKTGYALAAAGLDSIVIETGCSARQALSVIAAATAGQVSGAGTGTVTLKGAGVATTRIVATTDTDGNRSAVTLTLPS